MCLETERIVLRAIEAEDEDHLFELDSDPEVMRFLTGGTPHSRDQIKTALGRILALNQKHRGRFGFWAAIEKKSGLFLGWFHFRPDIKDPENTKRIELGYRLKRSAWGLGYATEVSKALIENGFRELGVVEVFAVTMKTNLASQQVMKKCGMEFVREFYDEKFPGAEVADVEFAIRNPRD